MNLTTISYLQSDFTEFLSDQLNVIIIIDSIQTLDTPQSVIKLVNT